MDALKTKMELLEAGEGRARTGDWTDLEVMAHFV
jgi:hypothetical protein